MIKKKRFKSSLFNLYLFSETRKCNHTPRILFTAAFTPIHVRCSSSAVRCDKSDSAMLRRKGNCTSRVRAEFPEYSLPPHDCDPVKMPLELLLFNSLCRLDHDLIKAIENKLIDCDQKFCHHVA